MSEHTAMTHKEASLFLVEYTAHELAKVQRTAVEQHVIQCEECQQAIAEIQLLRSSLALLASSPQANATMGEYMNESSQQSTLADTVLAQLSMQDSTDEMLPSTFVFDVISRPLSGIQGVIDAELQVNPLVRNNGNFAPSMRAHGLPEAIQQERSGPIRMKNALSTYPKKGWQQHLGILVAMLFLTLMVGSMVVVFTMAAHNRGGDLGSPNSGGPIPICTPTPMPTPHPQITPTPAPTPNSAQHKSHCATPTPTGPIPPTPAPTISPIPPTPTPTGPILPTPAPTPSI